MNFIIKVGRTELSIKKFRTAIFFITIILILTVVFINLNYNDINFNRSFLKLILWFIAIPYYEMCIYTESCLNRIWI